MTWKDRPRGMSDESLAAMRHPDAYPILPPLLPFLRRHHGQERYLSSRYP